MNNIHIRWILIIAYHILKNGCGFGFGTGIIHTIYAPIWYGAVLTIPLTPVSDRIFSGADTPPP
jgi:hypothetical protein